MKKTKVQRGTILYKILPTDAIVKEQKEIIDTKLRAIKTGDDAEKLSGTDGWGYHKTFHPGSVGILTFRGIEVGLFYKRQAISVQSEECDPAPAYRITDPREIWIRVEFMHVRASSLRTTWYMEKEEDYNSVIQHLEAINKNQRIENDLLNAKLVEQDKEIEALKEAVGKWKKRYLGKKKP